MIIPRWVRSLIGRRVQSAADSSEQKWLRLKDGQAWSHFFGRTSWSGRTVTVEGALKLSAWWACVRLISETIATLPLDAFERAGDGKRELGADHWLVNLLKRPNGRQTFVEFWEGQVAPVCIVGNSFAEKVFTGSRITSLLPMPFDRTWLHRTPEGEIRYRVNDRGKVEELPPEKVLHIRGFGIGGDVGLSPVAYARNTLGGAMDTEEAAARVFGTGLRAAGFMMSPQTLNKQQRELAHKNLIEPLEGPKAEGKIGLLEAGWKFQPTNIPPKDAEMILSRKFNVEDICRWMGVPPILVGHAAEGQTMWGSGIEQIMLGWLTLGLRAYIKRIEAAINKHIVPVRDQARIYAEFNIDGLVRADSAARAQLMSALAQNGLRTRNELRALDNLPPKPGGDQLTVQSNLVPIEKLGAAGDPTEAVRNALRAWLLQDEEKDR